MSAARVRRGHMSVPLEGGHSECHTYDDYPPIVSVATAAVTLSLTVPDPATVTAADTLAARALLDAARTYLAELDRIYAAQQIPGEAVAS